MLPYAVGIKNLYIYIHFFLTFHEYGYYFPKMVYIGRKRNLDKVLKFINIYYLHTISDNRIHKELPNNYQITMDYQRTFSVYQ